MHKWPEQDEEYHSYLCAIFVRTRLPHRLLSDNGPQFTQEFFQNFMKRNSVRHVTGRRTISPRLLPTVGRAFGTKFQTFYKGREKQHYDSTQGGQILALVPHSTPNDHGEELGGILVQPQPASKLDLTRPPYGDVEVKVLKNEQNPMRSFEPGQSVMVRNYRERTLRACTRDMAKYSSAFTFRKLRVHANDRTR